MTQVVQLEIRGVGGATASEILDGPVQQVAGDRLAGFYRRRDEEPQDRIVEAYEWGRLTSGARSSAMFWVLLPFTLLNVAGWMFRPLPDELDRDEEPARSTLWWGRLAIVGGGLAMTAIYTIFLATLGIEIIGLDCGGVEACRAKAYMAPLRWFDAHPLWRLTVGAVVAAALLFGLLLFVRRSQDRLEGYEPDAAYRMAGAQEAGWQRRNTRLEEMRFWAKWDEHRRLFRTHVIVATSTFGGVVGHVVGRLEWGAIGGGLRLAMVAAGAGGAVALWVIAAADAFVPMGGRSGRYERRPARRIAWTAVYVAAGVLSGLVALAVTRSADPDPFGGRLHLLRSVGWVSVVLYVQAVVLIGLLLWRRWREREGDALPGRRFRYVAPVVAGGLAVYVAGAGLGSVTYLVARGLLGSDRVAGGEYSASVVDVFAVAIAVVAVWSVVEFLFGTRDRGGVVDDYYPGRTEEELTDRERGWVKDVAGGRWVAALPGRFDLRLTVMFLVMLALQFAQVVQVEGFNVRFWEWASIETPLFGASWLAWLHPAAATVIALYLFPGIQLVNRMTRTRRDRRQLGKVWDVLSFWPRRFHPLAAPCYAERAVPEFRHAIKHHLQVGRRVVVSAHSQGTVIAFAALLQIKQEERAQRPVVAAGASIDRYAQMASIAKSAGEPEPIVLEENALRRVALVTFGSPLGSLYEPFFPGQFGLPGRFAGLRDELFPLAIPPDEPAWQNFYRPTDYIGREVFIGPGGALGGQAAIADVKLLEALSPLFPYESHSNYERDPWLRWWIDEMVRQIG